MTATLSKRATFRVQRDGWWVLRDLLADDVEVNPDSASFRVRHVGEYDTASGRLPEPLARHFRDHVICGLITYVAYSYDTPIGWRYSDGTWIIPAIRYSVTTTRHTNKLRVAVGEL